MTRWQIPISLSLALAFGAMILLAGCPEDPAEAMLKQARAQGGGATPPPATSTASTPPAGGTPATPGNPPPGGGTPPPGGPPPAGGAPGKPGAPGAPAAQRGAPGMLPPTKADAKAKPAGPKVTFDVKNIKAPYPRYSGKGRYDVTADVAVTPAQDEGVWKITALGSDGKVVGAREEQLVLLREKPRTLMFNDFYCLSAPKAFKMELALDKDGNPKKATSAGGGVGDNGGSSDMGKNGPGGMGNVPPGGGRGAGGAGNGGGG